MTNLRTSYCIITAYSPCVRRIVMFRKLVFVLASLAAVLCAQVLPVGTVDGSIYDSTGGALPGIKVSLRHEQTNQVRTAVTNDMGYYFFPLVNPGPYEV